MLHSANNQGVRSHHGQRGVSLIEVLVVMVILLVGIFSIAQLFPGGFFAVRSAENSTLADRLAQAQLETLKQNNAFLLDAIYMYTDDGVLNPNFSPTDLSGTTTSPYTPPAPSTVGADVRFDDINKARFIAGEKFTVPTVNTGVGTPTNGLSIHVLNYGPISLPLLPTQLLTSPSVPASVKGQPAVHSAPWTAKVGNSQQTVADDPQNNYTVAGVADVPADLIMIGQPNFAVDYTGQRIAIPPAPYVQYFTFIVKRLVTVTNSQGVVTSQGIVTFYYPLVLPAANPSQPDPTQAYNGIWFDPSGATGPNYLDPSRQVVTDVTPPNGNGAVVGNWIPNAGQLTCSLQAESSGGSTAATLMALQADPNPYTYVIYDSDTTLTNVSPGVLAFNPRLVGQQISASYLSYDWHIIHDDAVVPGSDAIDPGNPGVPIRLTLNHLQAVGDVNSDQSIYNGMFRIGDTTNSANNYDVVLLDTDTGEMAGLYATEAAVFNYDNPSSGTIATNQVGISYLGGRITLPTDSSNVWYYGNHKHLRIFYKCDQEWGVVLQKAPSLYVAGNPALQVATFAQDPSNSLYLDFPKCDTGQVVEMDDISYVDTNGVQRQVSGASGTIAINSLGTDSNPYVDLTPFLPNVNPSVPIQIGDVRGISALSSVVWKERDLWKTRSADTILTNGQGQ